MNIKRLLRSLALIAAAWPCLASAYDDLVFDGTRFVYKETRSKPSLGGGEFTLYIYEQVGQNKHDCYLTVDRMPNTSTVDGMLRMDASLFRPPITIAPFEIVKSKANKYVEDSSAIILLRGNQENSKYSVSFHRLTAIPGWGVREMRVQCSLKYAGLFGNSLSEYEDVKAAWVENLFALDPEVASAQPDAPEKPGTSEKPETSSAASQK